MQPDYSKAALFKFVETAERQGLMNSNTAASLRAAAAKLLEDVGDAEDIRNTDVQAAKIRHHNKHPGDLTPGSLRTYETRLRRLLHQFFQYTEDPTKFKPRSRAASKPNGDREGHTESKGRKRPKATARREVTLLPSAAELMQPASATSTSLAMSYPLRENFVAQVVLPRNMTSDEARKLCAFIRTLATDFMPAD